MQEDKNLDTPTHAIASDSFKAAAKRPINYEEGSSMHEEDFDELIMDESAPKIFHPSINGLI